MPIYHITPRTYNHPVYSFKTETAAQASSVFDMWTADKKITCPSFCKSDYVIRQHSTWQHGKLRDFDDFTNGE